MEEINKAQELMKNAEATKTDIDNEIIALEKALLAFNLANATPGSGTAPKVTLTNKYVATGATQALVRATVTGSNILERGVCWSTEHNPTVLDNRTTKSFSLNGTIFHIKGMKPSTVYYIRPYVMNKTYTVAYGDEVKIVTHPAGGCTWSWNEGAPDDAANTTNGLVSRDSILLATMVRALLLPTVVMVDGCALDLMLLIRLSEPFFTKLAMA